jgi:hypothetical protein
MIEYEISYNYEGHEAVIRFLAKSDRDASNLVSYLLPLKVWSTCGFAGPYKISDCENPIYILKL